MSPPRIVLTLAVGEPVGVSVLGVKSGGDARRLMDELGKRWKDDEIRTALGRTWDALNEQAREAS